MSATLRFAAIGLDHRHIYDQVRSLLDIGAECVGWWTEDLAALPVRGFQERFPDIPRIDDKRRLLEDPAIQLITCAAIPRDRAALAIAAMEHGKDFMVDKPGVVTSAQLEAVKAAQAATGRIFSVDFTERFEVRATTRAGQLVRDGAIGKVIHTVGLGPHRLNRHLRPAWFFDPAAYGGILVDIASHQFDQFLHFTGAEDAEIITARVDNRGTPSDPAFQDIGEVMMEGGGASGYARVDWFTPDGMPTWGDGRAVLTGTEGMIELRKYVDIAGRPGIDHLFLADAKGVRHIDCSDCDLPYYRQLRDDVFNRTETAMAQSHCFKVCELALKAQAMAEAARASA